jgi:prevent-host-death family protein
MEQRVSVREVNQHFTRYVKAAEAGDRIVITRRGRPVALLAPLPPQEKALGVEREAALERILGQSHHLGGRAPSRDELHELHVRRSPFLAVDPFANW